MHVPLGGLFVARRSGQLAGEMARRSEPKDDSSLARRMGAGTVGNLVSQVTGVPRSQAGTMVASGEAFRPRQNPVTGQALPAVCPQIADAFADGLLDPEVAAAMRRALARAAPGLAPYEVDRLEAQIIAVSQEGWDADLFLAYLKKVPETAHPDGGAPRCDDAAPVPSVIRRELTNGLVRWVMDLATLTDGFLKTAVDANTAIKRSLLTTPDDPEPDADTTDRRPLAQRRVDGVHRLAKLGGKSQPLDLGYARRYFTEAQRRAMVIRDGGCVGPGCDAPPSWCDRAHIRPAGYGPTSLDNGILLCWRCHQLLDLHGWQIQRTDDRWWWTPPPWIDSSGRQRPGGRIPPTNLDK